MSKNVLVAGGGGFIAGHLVRRLLDEGYSVRAADIKPLADWWQTWPDAQNIDRCDLSKLDACMYACAGVHEVYNLAASMGGIGHIETHRYECAMNVLISAHMLQAAIEHGVERFFYSSSACVYHADRQRDPNVTALCEADAYFNGGSAAELGYGQEKLYAEWLCQYAREDRGLRTRVARFHNVYGPCFDDTTEVLTKSGWKLFADLAEQDEIATLNLDSGLMEYHQPVERQAYHYSGDMYRVKHRAADLLVTPDHAIYYATVTTGPGGARVVTNFKRGAVKDSKWNRLCLYFSCHVNWQGEDRPDYVIAEARMSDGRSMGGMGGDEKIVDMDDWLRFVGWYISEGSSWVTPSNHTVCITQHDDDNREEIITAVSAIGFHHSNGGNVNVIISSKQLYAAVQQFGVGAKGKIIPREYLSLPPSRLKVLFDALMAGDGDADGGRYSTASRQLADDVMELSLKIGIRAWIGKESSEKGVIYRVHLSPQTRLDTARNSRTIEQYDGMVYDVTVPNHIMMVRRNGKPMWSGNCGSWCDGREKAPAAICRKVATAVLTDNHQIEIWGDGTATRSFCYVHDCIQGILDIMRGDNPAPVNLGSAEMVTINRLVDYVEEIAGIKLERSYKLDAPKGVAGRNSDNTEFQRRYGWTPSVSLRDGLAKTYEWIEQQVKNDMVQGAVAETPATAKKLDPPLPCNP